MAGAIFALDLASRTGWAKGPVGTAPQSGTTILKQGDEPAAVAFGNLIAWLDEEWKRERPALVVSEAPFSLQAFGKHKNAEATVKMTYGLHSILAGMCHRFSLRLEQVHAATVRKHFIGKGNAGSREETKAVVVHRCHVLSYMPKDCLDDNRADALATWDWAAARVQAPKELHFFGEHAA